MANNSLKPTAYAVNNLTENLDIVSIFSVKQNIYQMRIKLVLSILLFIFANSTAQDSLWICLEPRWPLNHPCQPDQFVDFDNHLNPIIVDSIDNNLWQIGTTSKFNSTYLPYKKSVVTDTLNDYPINNYSTFKIVVVGNFYPDSYLSFIHRYDTDQGQDGCRIEIFNSQEKKWEDVIDASGLVYTGNNLYSETDTVTALNNKPGFSGSIVWEEVTLYFTTFGIDTIELKFIFASDSVDNNRDGWIIDNIYFVSWYEGIQQSVNYPIVIFPNPFSEKIEIRNSNANLFYEPTVAILDINGVTRYKTSNYDYSVIQLEHLEPGIYLIRVNDEHHNYYQTIVKM